MCTILFEPFPFVPDIIALRIVFFALYALIMVNDIIILRKKLKACILKFKGSIEFVREYE
jgi:hypothetical protein